MEEFLELYYSVGLAPVNYYVECKSSLAFVSLIVSIEEKYSVTIPEEMFDERIISDVKLFYSMVTNLQSSIHTSQQNRE